MARYVAIWNYVSSDVETFRHGVRMLHEHCAAIGRDPAEIELSVQTRVNYDDLATTANAVKPYIDAGATHLVLTMTFPYPDRIVAKLADEVVGRVG